MAERRHLLNLEQYAHRHDRPIATSLDLDRLCQGTRWTTVSENAGSYVCNDLYYQILTFTQKHQLPIHCLFVHVPPLTKHNQAFVFQDFTLILSRLHSLDSLLKLTTA
jgi:pyroglutamyl-peptidase